MESHLNSFLPNLECECECDEKHSSWGDDVLEWSEAGIELNFKSAASKLTSTTAPTSDQTLHYIQLLYCTGSNITLL